MDRLTKVAAALGILLLLSIMAGTALFVSLILSLDSEPQNFSHQIEYSAELRTNGSLNDTEMLVPFPEDERFRDAVENGSEDPNITISNDLNA